MAKPDHKDLLAAVVHELRAPLNACLMAVSLLEFKAEEPGAVRNAAELIRRNLTKQANLIADFADVVQIIWGEPQLELQRIGADVLVARMLAAARPLAKERGVELSRGTSTRRTVETDVDKASQAFGALLQNLLSACAAGDRVSISASAQGSRIRIAARIEIPAEVNGKGSAGRSDESSSGAGSAGRSHESSSGTGEGNSTGQPVSPPSREQKALAIRVLIAESLLESIGAVATRGTRDFNVRLPTVGRD